MPCSCGNPVKVGEVLCSRCAALRVLELKANAGEQEIRNAYHAMVKVWHPDRFQGDARLSAMAEAKLKEVNAAYELLKSGPSAERARRGANTRAQDASRQRPPQGATYKARRKSAAAGGMRGFSSAQIFFGLNIVFKCVLALVVLLLCRYLWIAFDVLDTTSEAANNVLDYGKDTVGDQLEGPKRRFLAAIEDDLERLGIRHPAPVPSAILEMGSAPSAANLRSGSAPPSSSGARQGAGAKAARKVYSFITVGSTRDEVLDQAGTPTESSANKLVYGRSELYFDDNKVVGWRIDAASPTIRVKLWPETPLDPTLDSFTLGSSKDVVLVVQGTPTAFSEDKFEYGSSVVNFQNRRVVSWKSDPASIPLRARQP